MLSRKSCSPHSRISCQYIIHIIKSLIICYNVFTFYTKAELVTYLYILRIKIRLRPCKSAFWTIIISQLAVMIKTIFQFLTASLAETSLPDLICRRFDHRFTDTISYIWIPGIHGKICRQGIITVYNNLHLRNLAHHFFQNVHSDINLSVSVKLVAEKICQKHIVRFDSRKNMSGGCFIGLNACIVRINFTIPFRSQHKCGNNSIEHIGTCMVTDYFLSFRFQCRTEHIVGSCLSICTAGCKNSLSHL